MKKTTIVVIILLIGVVLSFFYWMGAPEKYRNDLLGYELTVPVGWHVSEILSKKIDYGRFSVDMLDFAGCNVSKIAEQNDGIGVASTTELLQDCIKKSAEFSNFNSKLQDFSDKWTINNSMSVFISKMSNTDEMKLSLADLTMAGDRLPVGSFIQVMPFDSILDFKEATSTNKSNLIRSFYYISDGTKAFLTDFRNSKLVKSGISLSVPITTDISIFNGENLQNIKSLIIKTTAKIGSKEEADFMDLIKSLKINLK